jgi:hypothetical protein
MAKTAGRPKKAVKHERFTSIGLTRSEDFIIREKAAKAGLPLSGYLRTMAIYGQVHAKFTDEELNFVKQLIGMSSNLHQLTRIAQHEGMLQAIMYFETYRNRIDELLNHLQKCSVK